VIGFLIKSQSIYSAKLCFVALGPLVWVNRYKNYYLKNFLIIGTNNTIYRPPG